MEIGAHTCGVGVGGGYFFDIQIIHSQIDYVSVYTQNT